MQIRLFVVFRLDKIGLSVSAVHSIFASEAPMVRQEVTSPTDLVLSTDRSCELTDLPKNLFVVWPYCTSKLV